jgi:hypothetical protein
MTPLISPRPGTCKKLIDPNWVVVGSFGHLTFLPPAPPLGGFSFLPIATSMGFEKNQ